MTDEQTDLLRTIATNQVAILKRFDISDAKQDRIIARLDDVHGALELLIGHTQELGAEVKEVIDAAKVPDGENADPFQAINDKLDGVDTKLGIVGDDVKAIPDQFVEAVGAIGKPSKTTG